MAGVLFGLTTAKVTTGTALITILQVVAPANQRIKIKEISVSFNGAVNTDLPIYVNVMRQTTAGTMSALTPKKWNNADTETLQVTGQHTASAEPTASDIIMAEQVHPQTGYTWQAKDREEEIAVPGGTRLGIVVTAAVSVSCVVRVVGEE